MNILQNKNVGLQKWNFIVKGYIIRNVIVTRYCTGMRNYYREFGRLLWTRSSFTKNIRLGTVASVNI